MACSAEISPGVGSRRAETSACADTVAGLVVDREQPPFPALGPAFGGVDVVKEPGPTCASGKMSGEMRLHDPHNHHAVE